MNDSVQGFDVGPTPLFPRGIVSEGGRIEMHTRYSGTVRDKLLLYIPALSSEHPMLKWA